MKFRDEKTRLTLFLFLFAAFAGCGQNRIELERIEAPEETSPQNAASLFEMPDQPSGKDESRIPSWHFEKDDGGRWIINEHVIRDLAYLRALKNRSLEKRGLDPDNCLIDVLSDLDRLVRKLGGRGAAISPGGIGVFVNELSGAEFIPWQYVKSYIIVPADYGVDMHLIFDEERIRADDVPIEAGTFLYKTKMKANDGRMKQERFWVSLHTKFSVAQKVRIHPPDSDKTYTGFGVALEGVSVQVIGRLKIQSIIIMRACNTGSGQHGRKVVVAVEGFIRKKNPRPLFAQCGERLRNWAAQKVGRGERKKAKTVPNVARRGDVMDQEAIESIQAQTCSAVEAAGNSAGLSVPVTLEVKQKATLISMAWDYWYLTIALCFCELYSIYKLLMLLGKMAFKLVCLAGGKMAAVVVGSSSVLARTAIAECGNAHYSEEPRRRLIRYVIATAVILAGCNPETTWLVSMKIGRQPEKPRPVVDVYITDVEQYEEGRDDPYLLEELRCMGQRKTKLSFEQDLLISQLSRARREGNRQAEARLREKYRAIEAEKRKVDIHFMERYNRIATRDP